MKLTTGINILKSKNLDKKISKKIILANTSGKLISKEARDKSYALSNMPENMKDPYMYMTTDIRFRNNLNYSSLANIDYRNALLMFAENKEIKKAVSIMANEIVVTNNSNYKYPVYPRLNLNFVAKDKKDTAKAISNYYSQVFYPKLWQMLNFKKSGLIDMIKEFLITGKIAYEIIYDNISNPKEIIGIQSIDACTLQKFIEDDVIYYVQKAPYGDRDRVLQENQVILLEWNKYDFGYVSYVDGLRMSFNTMRSMQTSKILWFAAKSQVRMHIKFALGDVSRQEALQKLSQARNDFTNKFTFSEDGNVLFNNSPNNEGYREFFTAETNASGHPEIEEVTGNGPDLTEVESLEYWERLYWNDTGIPYDRIDPSSSDSWGFNDVESLRKIEIAFAKTLDSTRIMLEDVFLKPLIIQLTLKEVEIGVDLTLLDAIKLEWVSYNRYEKMADIEIMAKKIEMVTSMKEFGFATNSAGYDLPLFSIDWLARNYLDMTESDLQEMEVSRIDELDKLGYKPDGTPKMTDEESAMNNASDEDDSYDTKDDEDIDEPDIEPIPEDSPEDIEEADNSAL